MRVTLSTPYSGCACVASQLRHPFAGRRRRYIYDTEAAWTQSVKHDDHLSSYSSGIAKISEKSIRYALRFSGMKPQFELADIIRRYAVEFYLQHPVLDCHKRVLNALENCRTPAPGGHVEQCDECGEIHISYNSCRNRHCPKCQGPQRVTDG